jgi:putative two-component system response regulator
VAGIGSAAIVYALPLVRVFLAFVVLGLTVMACIPSEFDRFGFFISPLLPYAAVAGNLVAGVVRDARAQSEKGRRGAMELRVANEFMLAALASLIALRDDDCHGHVTRVQNSLRLLCENASASPRFSLSAETVELLISVAPIHDIGKVGIPDAILRKAGRLTPEETELIRRHVLYGRQVLESARDKSGLNSPAIFEMCPALVYSHHERWDGSGYPLGLKGEAIPLPARLPGIPAQ